MFKILFLAKTDLNKDGRILNQIRILQNHFGEKLKIDFILFPDKPLDIKLGDNIEIHYIQTSIRNSKFLRSLTVFQFIWKTLIKLLKLNPEIVHAEDSAVVLPVYIYRLLRGRSFKLIYDDHEMPNENEPLTYRLIQYFEVKLMKLSDIVIFANKERMEILKKQYRLQNKLNYFLNLPYFDDIEKNVENNKYSIVLEKLRSLILNGTKFIIHQGSLEVERGREILASFSKLLPSDIKLLTLGISKEEFDEFITEYQLNRNNFYFVGSIPYKLLNHFWRIGSAAVVMYLPTFINNRLCAPNRFYIAVKNQLPVLVNRDNPVLNNFINEYKAGGFIEDIHNIDDIKQFLEYSYPPALMKDLIEQEIEKFITIYKQI